MVLWSIEIVIIIFFCDKFVCIKINKKWEEKPEPDARN